MRVRACARAPRKWKWHKGKWFPAPHGAAQAQQHYDQGETEGQGEQQNARRGGGRGGGKKTTYGKGRKTGGKTKYTQGKQKREENYIQQVLYALPHEADVDVGDGGDGGHVAGTVNVWEHLRVCTYRQWGGNGIRRWKFGKISVA